MTSKAQVTRSFLSVQWLGLWTFTAKGLGWIPGWANKISQATWHSQKIDKFGIKIKNVCESKDTIKSKKKKWEKIFANHIFDKEYPELVKNSCNSITKRQTAQFQNGQRTK